MKFAGSSFYPTTVIVTVCATSSSLCSLLCVPLASTQGEQQWIKHAASLFSLVALGTSPVAGFSLLTGGSPERIGTLVIQGRSVPAEALWMTYMALFVVSWCVVVAVLAGGWRPLLVAFPYL